MMLAKKYSVNEDKNNNTMGNFIPTDWKIQMKQVVKYKRLPWNISIR